MKPRIFVTMRAVSRLKLRNLVPSAIAVAGVAFLAATLWLVPVLTNPFRGSDPSKYADYLARIQRRLAPASTAHMPRVLPPHAEAVTVSCYDQRPDHGSRGLYLRCRLPSSDVDSLFAQWSGLAIRSITDSTRSYATADWSNNEPGVDKFAGLPRDFEVILLYEQGPDSGTDMTSGGLAVRHSDNTVTFWVYRHWAQFN